MCAHVCAHAVHMYEDKKTTCGGWFSLLLLCQPLDLNLGHQSWQQGLHLQKHMARPKYFHLKRVCLSWKVVDLRLLLIINSTDLILLEVFLLVCLWKWFQKGVTDAERPTVNVGRASGLIKRRKWAQHHLTLILSWKHSITSPLSMSHNKPFPLLSRFC